jgi:hypothetical protein
MKFVNKLRNVKEQSKEAAQRALERVRDSGVSLERHLRQKMRIYPPSLRPAASSVNPESQTATAFDEELEETERISLRERKPIVSIRGKDLEPTDPEDDRRKRDTDRRIA